MRRDCADLTEVVVKSGHWMAQEKPVAVNAALAQVAGDKAAGLLGRLSRDLAGGRSFERAGVSPRNSAIVGFCMRGNKRNTRAGAAQRA